MRTQRESHTTQVSLAPASRVAHGGALTRWAMTANETSAVSAACTLCKLVDVPEPWSVDATRIAPRLQKLCDCGQAPRNLMVDVGTSMLASKPDALAWIRQNRSRRVIGFEAHPSNCETVYKAFESIGQRFVCKAVADSAGTLMLDGTGQQGTLGYNGPADNGTSSLSVPVTTLDSELSHTRPIWVLKIDVQGSEVRVLRGAQGLLDRGLISWVYTEMAPYLLRDSSAGDKPSSASTLLDVLEAAGFACVNSRRKNMQRLLTENDRLFATAENRSKFCAYTCPCKYTNLLCGHRRVAVAPRRWKEALLGELCDQPQCVWNADWQGLGRNMCNPPSSNQPRMLFASFVASALDSLTGEANIWAAMHAFIEGNPLTRLDFDWHTFKVRMPDQTHTSSWRTHGNAWSHQSWTLEWSVVSVLACMLFLAATCKLVLHFVWTPKVCSTGR